MKPVKLFLIMFALVGLSMGTLYAQTYSIVNTDKESFYDVYKGSSLLCTNSIQGVFDVINVDADGKPCTIQFGTGGSNVLELFEGGTTLIFFGGGYGSLTWGEITLTGKAICAGHRATICIWRDISIKCKAEITGIGETRIFSNYGTLTISDGAIIGGEGAISNNGGTLFISGGTVSSYQWTIYNSNDVITGNDGKLSISGGTVSATGGYGIAIANYSTEIVTISGGTVLATRSSPAVYNHNSIGRVTINGGMILAYDGCAVENKTTRTVAISGGIVFASSRYGINITNVIIGDYTQSNNAVIVAWDGKGSTDYIAGTSNDIYKLPETASAMWAKNGGSSGILVANGTNTGFIPVADVTVETMGIETTETDNYSVYPNPTNDVLHFSHETPFEIIDLQGKVLLKSEKAVNTVHINSLSSGVYFIKLTTETGNIVKKIVKN